MQLKILNEEFTVCKLKDISEVRLFVSKHCFLGITDEEISLVCPIENTPSNTIKRDDGWKGFKIQGELDFSLIGILSQLSSILADNNIGIFAVSTYNTDYIFTKKENFDRALNILSKSGYELL